MKYLCVCVFFSVSPSVCLEVGINATYRRTKKLVMLLKIAD